MAIIAIDKILKETTTKALDEKKIKPALQPKIDLKQFGEGKDLEYVISVTEMPKVKLNTLDNIKYKEYKVTDLFVGSMKYVISWT